MREQLRPGTFVWYASEHGVGLGVVVEPSPSADFVHMNWIIPPTPPYPELTWYYRDKHSHYDFCMDCTYLTPVEEQPK
jgi:hypothetical protein